MKYKAQTINIESDKDHNNVPFEVQDQSLIIHDTASNWFGKDWWIIIIDEKINYK